MTTNEQLQARVAELEAENARLKVMEESALKVCGQLDEVVIALPYDYLDPPDGGDVSLGEQVTRMYSEVKTLRHAVVIAQAEIKRLRKHTEWNKCIKDSVDKLLEMAGYHVESSSRHQLGLMNFDCIAQPSDTSALDAYVDEKVKEYQKHNGILGRDVKDLTRQRNLAVEALSDLLEFAIDSTCGKTHAVESAREALVTIKESEASA